MTRSICILTLVAVLPGCGQPAALRRATDLPSFPLDVNYCRDDRWAHLELDEHRVVTFRVGSQDRVYGKIDPRDFAALHQLVRGAAFRDALRSTRSPSAPWTLPSRCDVATLYGNDGLTLRLEQRGDASSTVPLDDRTSVPGPIVTLFERLDSSCMRIFGDRYLEILDPGPSRTEPPRYPLPGTWGS